MASPAIDRESSNRRPAEDIPHYQPWLGVTSAAFIPCILLFFLPHAFLIPMIVLALALMGIGMTMLVRQETRARTKR